jgi:hypothetical protein
LKITQAAEIHTATKAIEMRGSMEPAIDVDYSGRDSRAAADECVLICCEDSGDNRMISAICRFKRLQRLLLQARRLGAAGGA